MLTLWYLDEILRGRNYGRMIDQDILDKLEAGLKKLQGMQGCKSLLKKYLTKEVFDACKSRKTKMGATLLDVIQSGVENLDSEVGIYAPDADSYNVFSELFNPIIAHYHSGFSKDDIQLPMSFDEPEPFVDLDPENKYVLSTRVALARNVEGYTFGPCLKKEDYKDLESRISTVLLELEGKLKGEYNPLEGMDKKKRQMLIDEGCLFTEGDRFLEAANACRYWPVGRGIFYNKDKSFLVWVNAEDHIRMISVGQRGDLKNAYKRLKMALSELGKELVFCRDERLGFLTLSPANIGTTIKTSCNVHLPKLSRNPKMLKATVARLNNLQLKEAKGGNGAVWDISNKCTIGKAEYELVKEVQDGILEIIKVEKQSGKENKESVKEV